MAISKASYRNSYFKEINFSPSCFQTRDCGIVHENQKVKLIRNWLHKSDEDKSIFIVPTDWNAESKLIGDKTKVTETFKMLTILIMENGGGCKEIL